ARKFPIRLLESGPAGGGLATALFGKLAGENSVISFDMGGTTAKACLVEDGRIEVASMMEAARMHRFKRGSGLPIKAPVIDMTEVGRLGDEIGLSAVEAAYGIHKVVTESMAAAARIHLVEKGKDPRAYAMVGFGGAGPAHAAGVARILGIREVIIPPASGAASCLGFLAAPLSFEHVRSHPVRLVAGYDAAAVNHVLAALEAEGRAPLSQAGVAAADMLIERTADMRLVGQMHEINVALPAGILDETSLPAIRAAFAQVYIERYTTFDAAATIEAVS